jgi:hypothetical protein
VINQEEIALGFNKLSYIRTLPNIYSFFDILNHFSFHLFASYFSCLVSVFYF